MHILIIGAGPGGYETAVEALRRGHQVTLVTDSKLGGTCLNEGCIPTKSLIYNCCEKSVPLSEAISVKRQVLDQLGAGIETLLRKAEVIYGKASFVDTHTVKVGDRTVSADRIIIATGSVSASLPVPGAELTLNSSQLLEVEEVPSRLTVIGGGVIGLEFACIFNSLGSEVTVLEYCPCILPRFDVDMAKRLKQQLVRSGIKVVTGAAVKAVSRNEASSDGSFSVEYELKNQMESIAADCVLMAVGRRPATDSLNLQDVGIEFDRRAGIKVDSRMRTNVPDIYAVGDVTGGIMLAHMASAQGLRALNDIDGTPDSIDFNCVPAVVFTSVELATVGMSEEDCKHSGIAYSVHKSTYRANGKAVASGQVEGCCKVIAGEDGRILGCHILGAHASDMIAEATALISLGVTLDRARWIIHAHPTLSEVFQAAIRE